MLKLKKYFLIILLSSLMFSCNQNEKSNFEDLMIVKGSIRGLRKGKLYLQRIKDTMLINLDSAYIDGSPEFRFQTPIKTPEVFYLYLNKDDGDSLNDRILFFGEKGTIEINTLLKTFESSAKISGSKNQELLQKYQSMRRKFNDKNLDLLKDLYVAKGKKQIERVDTLEKKIASLLNRRYLYTINFAAQNPDQNLAPYLAITEVYDANLTLLDSIANKLTNKVKASKYGIEFLNLLEKRRKNEKN
ncbi:MAG: hypothetical protein CBC28_01155 [Flavobacteriaceae bacterium TMED68]|nr:MAG: hypothetical protein CBC28_01155 [Flavobacteriaceae bacterium TMED68]|tara:strand:+ start:86216 stop:86950 length:735 start_codon:yes stop_codon:yes gene_type:complete